MATATLPRIWIGRSAVHYEPAEGSRVRHGGMATVRKVVGRGLNDAQPLALKLWHEGDDAALQQIQVEAETMRELAEQPGELPCPRMFDLVGQPLVTGIVMEWCPADLERWWREKLAEPDAFGRLIAALAEISHRVADYHDWCVLKRGYVVPHGDLKPTNMLLSTDGRWLVSDFGAAAVRRPEDNALGMTRVVAGTENFIPPEAVFHSRKPFPAALDTWALAASAFSLLRLRRMVLDDSQVPRNGTHNLRFRTQRVSQVLEVYAKDPTRFESRDLDPGAFPDPLRLPEEDRRQVRDGVRGIFGADRRAAEDEIADLLLDLLDRAMSIDPAHRFTSARDLGVAFEELTRRYVALAATMSAVATLPPAEVAAAVSTGRIPMAALAAAEGAELANRVRQLEAKVASLESANAGPSSWPRWWGLALVMVVGLQGATLAVALAALVLLVLRA